MHQTQKCTTFPKNPLAVLPVKGLLVKISYIETCNHNISPNELKLYLIRDECIRIISTKFHDSLSLFSVDASCSSFSFLVGIASGAIPGLVHIRVDYVS
jgi:hypothetical protein